VIDVGPFVLLHVRIQRRSFGWNQLLYLGGNWCPKWEFLTQGPFSTLYAISRILYIFFSTYRVLSLDSIPFGILLRWSATILFLCACKFIRTRQYTQVILTCSRYPGVVVVTLRNTNNVMSDWQRGVDWLLAEYCRCRLRVDLHWCRWRAGVKGRCLAGPPRCGETSRLASMNSVAERDQVRAALWQEKQD
jgi:hypothetical protein